MSGALLATLGATSGTGGVVPGALDWANIVGEDVGENAALTISGLGGTINIAASISGTGALSYNLNGDYVPNADPFGVSNGDTLSWLVAHFPAGRSAGTITVTNASDSDTVLDTFTYVVIGSGDE